jgi:hypothetical protein
LSTNTFINSKKRKNGFKLSTSLPYRIDSNSDWFCLVQPESFWQYLDESSRSYPGAGQKDEHVIDLWADLPL